nr:unnamed protein product [Spirometra erinaceieuropaei]
MSSTKLMDAYVDERPVISIVYRRVIHPLNSCRKQIPTRLFTIAVHDLFSTDDCVLNTAKIAHMRMSRCLFVSGCASFGLAVNTDKTAVVHQPPPNAPYNFSHVYVNGLQLKTVDSFVPLGSALSRCIKIDDEMSDWISIASQTSGRLQNEVWNGHGPYPNTSLKTYKSDILTMLMSGAETLTVH